MRLQRRLFLSYLAVAVTAVMIGAALVYVASSRQLRSELDKRLERTAGVLAAAIEAGPVPEDGDVLDDRVDDMAVAAAARLTLIDADGRVVADSEFDGPALEDLDDHSSRAEFGAARSDGVGRSVRYSRSVGTEMLYFARRIDRGPMAGGVIRVAVPSGQLHDAGRALFGGVAAALVIALGVSTLAALFWSRRVARPIGRLKSAAEAVRSGKLKTRVRVQTGDEIEALAIALDQARDAFATQIAEATHERDQLGAVLEAMVEGVVVTDRNGRVTVANPALLEIFGVPSPGIGRTVTEALRHPEVGAAMERASREGNPVVTEIATTFPESRTLSLHATPLSEGGAVGVFHDVTALKRVNVMRQDFVANVSHELRTPLAALSAHAESLQSGATPEETESSLAAIRRQVERLSALVQDLLQLSELESERFSLSSDVIDVGEFLRRIQEEGTERAGHTKQRISVEVDDDLTVDADRGLLRQAVTNLVENAVKYAGPEARIRLTGRRREGFVVIGVIDDGPGISLDEQSRVFERFYRVEKSRARSNGGTGLGLSIVKHIAEVHGGHVTLETRPGQGAAFRIALPIRSQP